MYTRTLILKPWQVTRYGVVFQCGQLSCRQQTECVRSHLAAIGTSQLGNIDGRGECTYTASITVYS